MGYRNITEFKAGLMEAGFRKETNQSIGRIEILFAYYQHARGQQNLILGRLDDIKPLVQLYGTAFEGGGELLVTPAGKTEEMRKAQGSRWSIWLNDSFILGGIHGHAVFYLKSSNLDALDRVDENSEFVFNVTQRELQGLIISGYGMGDRNHPKGVEYTCGNTSLADSATFRSYREHMQQLVAAFKK